MSQSKLTRSSIGILILLAAFLLMASSPVFAQNLYSIKIMKWNPTSEEWEQIRNRPVYFIINNVTIQSTRIGPEGEISINFAERARESWTAYVGPFRWQYYYHTNEDIPSLPPRLGGFEFPVNRRDGIVYISEI